MGRAMLSIDAEDLGDLYDAVIEVRAAYQVYLHDSGIRHEKKHCERCQAEGT